MTVKIELTPVFDTTLISLRVFPLTALYLKKKNAHDAVDDISSNFCWLEIEKTRLLLPPEHRVNDPV